MSDALHIVYLTLSFLSWALSSYLSTGNHIAPCLSNPAENSGFSATEENEDGSLRFSCLFSSLQESRQLCQSVYAALLTEGTCVTDHPVGLDHIDKE